MTVTTMAALPAALLLLLLTLIDCGSAVESPRPHRLLYKNNTTGKLEYCHLCVGEEFRMVSIFREDCYLQNVDATYKVNGVDYRPWCRARVGLVPSCPEPRQPRMGWVDCGETGTRVYGTCKVHCSQHYLPQTPVISCQEEDLKWSAEPTCLVSECPPLGIPAPCNITCEGDGPSKIGDQCNATCPEGFHPNIPKVTCQVDGTWSTTPLCEKNLLPLTGGPIDEGTVVASVVPVIGGLLVLCIVILIIYRQRTQGRKYSVAGAEEKLGSVISVGSSAAQTVGSSFSSRELPAVTTSRSAVKLSWSNISALFRNVLHKDWHKAEAGQRCSDVEAAEKLEMLPLGQVYPVEDQGVEEGEVDGDSSLSSEESPLLLPGAGSLDQEDVEPGESSQQQPEVEKEGPAHGTRKERVSRCKQVPVEVHSASDRELDSSSSSSSGEMKAISDKLDPHFIPPVGFPIRSRSSTPSDTSKPTYQWNLLKPVGFKVIIKNGEYKVLSKIIERDEELRVSRGLEVQISAKCQDHDEEVENFNVCLWNEVTGRGDVIKEATGNSFRFIACLISAREIYILSAQTSRSRRKHMVRFTLYTQGGVTSDVDPEETKVKQVYSPPKGCAPSNPYSPLPRPEPAAGLVSNTNNETFAQKEGIPASVSQDRKLPGRAGDVPYAETPPCSQPLHRLLEDAKLPLMTKLCDKLEPIPSRKEADTICGFYLHHWPDRKDHVDVTCWAKQGDRHCSPARVLLEEMAQEGLTTGHLVWYFAHPAHPRPDLLQMLVEAHPFQSCPACHMAIPFLAIS